jgi:hypothetical protein
LQSRNSAEYEKSKYKIVSVGLPSAESRQALGQKETGLKMDTLFFAVDMTGALIATSFDHEKLMLVCKKKDSRRLFFIISAVYQLFMRRLISIFGYTCTQMKRQSTVTHCTNSKKEYGQKLYGGSNVGYTGIEQNR